MRSFLGLLLALTLVPVLAVVIAVVPYVHGAGVTDPAAISGMALQCLIGTADSPDVAQLCDELRYFHYLGAGGLATVAVSFLGVCVAVVLAIATGWSRSLLSLSFPLVAFGTIVLLSVLLLVHAVLAAGALYLAESYFLETVHPLVMAAILLAGLASALAVARNVASMFRGAKTFVVGLPIAPVDAPHIHRVVHKIAKQLNSRPPKNIVLGFDPSFFVTSAKVYTPFQPHPLVGETLYLSLPLLRMLSETEVRSIIGHELAHFTGKDTAYSMRFAPAYRGLSDARQSLTEGGRDLMALPGVAVVDFVLGLFALPERAISRSRELRADKAGAEVGSAEALSAALVKLGVLSEVWSIEFEVMIARVKLGRFSRNLSKNFVERARYDIDHDKIAGLAALGLEREIAHPTDTHPATRERVKALAADPDALVELEAFKRGLFPQHTLISKADSIDRIEEQLTDAYQQLVLQSMGDHDSSEHEGNNMFSNLLSMFLAKMACIDGELLDSEIVAAQSEGFQYDRHFDPVSFKEHCRHPDQLPDTEKLVYWGNLMLNSGGAARLREVLKKVAGADGVVRPAEREFLDYVDENLVGSEDEAAG